MLLIIWSGNGMLEIGKINPDNSITGSINGSRLIVVFKQKLWLI
jgi:hypothetical protein